MDKGELRKSILSSLSSLSNDQIISLSFLLTQQLIKLLEKLPLLQSQIGAAYLPLPSEIAPAYQELLGSIPLVLSYPVKVDGEMNFGMVEGLPVGSPWLAPPFKLVAPKWFLVPGVGFSMDGFRLGRGKGFYDRYLENRSGIKIGLAWSGQLSDKIPVESHDCRMDYIVTEKFCWDVNQQKYV